MLLAFVDFKPTCRTLTHPHLHPTHNYRYISHTVYVHLRYIKDEVSGAPVRTTGVGNTPLRAWSILKVRADAANDMVLGKEDVGTTLYALEGLGQPSVGRTVHPLLHEPRTIPLPAKPRAAVTSKSLSNTPVTILLSRRGQLCGAVCERSWSGRDVEEEGRCPIVINFYYLRR